MLADSHRAVNVRRAPTLGRKAARVCSIAYPCVVMAHTLPRAWCRVCSVLRTHTPVCHPRKASRNANAVWPTHSLTRRAPPRSTNAKSSVRRAHTPKPAWNHAHHVPRIIIKRRKDKPSAMSVHSACEPCDPGHCHVTHAPVASVHRSLARMVVFALSHDTSHTAIVRLVSLANFVM